MSLKYLVNAAAGMSAVNLEAIHFVLQERREDITVRESSRPLGAEFSNSRCAWITKVGVVWRLWTSDITSDGRCGQCISDSLVLYRRLMSANSNVLTSQH